MWQRFTERARKVVFYAAEEAIKFGEGYVSTEHLLLGLVRETDGMGARVLEQLGCSLNRVRAEVEKQLPRGDARAKQDMTLTPRAKRVIDLAYNEARGLAVDYIGTEHLLLGMLREGDGLAGRVLKKLHVDLDRAREAVAALPKREKIEEPAAPLGPITPYGPKRVLSPMLLPIRQEIAIPEFLFLLCITDPEGMAARTLRELHVNVSALQTTTELTLMRKDQRTCEATLDAILAKASDLANEMQKPLSSAFIVLALLQIEAEPIVSMIEEAGVNAERYAEHLRKVES